MADQRLSPRRRAAFTAAMVLVPLLFFPALEGLLRLAGFGADLSLFVPPARISGDYLVVNPQLARRYFPTDPNPPGIPAEPFFRQKPAHGIRIFVLGESTAAGFPYLRNGTFSRIIGDALRDVLPGDTVEVVNVAVPAVSSFVLADLAEEVVAAQPDAIVVYAGHNEYYGVFGAASKRSGIGSTALTRAVIRLERFRTVQLFRRIIGRVIRRPVTQQGLTSRMEQQAITSAIPVGGETYLRGPEQLAENLSTLMRAARASGIPVFVGTQASNLRDQKPFGSVGLTPAENADSAFACAESTLRSGDAREARKLFTQARDLDAIRFRAPSAVNKVIAGVTAEAAIPVPTAEAVAALSPDSIPGRDVFFEHVHPRPRATTAIARAFFEAIVAHPSFNRRVRRERLASWADYERRMELTPVDEKAAQLTVTALMQHWPFAPIGTQSNFLASFHPVTVVDSGAFAAMVGIASWSDVKLELAKRYAARGQIDSAVAEYRGLMRDAPWHDLPPRRAGLLLESNGRDADAFPFLERARAVIASPDVMQALERIAARRAKPAR